MLTMVLKIALKKYKSLNIIYAPCFLFHLLANYDCIMEHKQKNTSHPNNLDRHKYIKEFIEVLHYDSLYSSYNDYITNICSTLSKKIKHGVISISSSQQKLLAIYENLHYNIREF